MKKRNVNNTLKLNKETVTNLEMVEMNEVNGGGGKDTFDTEVCCWEG